MLMPLLLNSTERRQTMCNVCYGIGNCPVCGSDSEEDFDELLDIELNQADEAIKNELENGNS